MSLRHKNYKHICTKLQRLNIKSKKLTKLKAETDKSKIIRDFKTSILITGQVNNCTEDQQGNTGNKQYYKPTRSKTHW